MVLTCSIAPRRDTSSTDTRLDILINELQKGLLNQESQKELFYKLLKQLKLQNIHLEKLSDLENVDLANDLDFDEEFNNGDY